MSWSLSIIGKPEALDRRIDAESSRLSGVSKEEFDAVAPHLKGLLGAAHPDAVVQIDGNGHASFTVQDGVRTRTWASLTVSLKQLGTLVE